MRRPILILVLAMIARCASSQTMLKPSQIEVTTNDFPVSGSTTNLRNALQFISSHWYTNDARVYLALTNAITNIVSGGSSGSGSISITGMTATIVFPAVSTGSASYALAQLAIETNRAIQAEAALYPRSNPSNYVTAAITNGLASTNWVVSQGYVTGAVLRAETQTLANVTALGRTAYATGDGEYQSPRDFAEGILDLYGSASIPGIRFDHVPGASTNYGWLYYYSGNVWFDTTLDSSAYRMLTTKDSPSFATAAQGARADLAITQLTASAISAAGGTTGTVVRVESDPVWAAASNGVLYAAGGASGTNTTGSVFVNGKVTTVGTNTPWTALGAVTNGGATINGSPITNGAAITVASSGVSAPSTWDIDLTWGDLAQATTNDSVGLIAGQLSGQSIYNATSTVRYASFAVSATNTQTATASSALTVPLGYGGTQVLFYVSQTQATNQPLVLRLTDGSNGAAVTAQVTAVSTETTIPLAWPSWATNAGTVIGLQATCAGGSTNAANVRYWGINRKVRLQK